MTIPMEIAVNKPAAEVWKRVGKYCDISEWFQIVAGCKITSGVDGEVGCGAHGRREKSSSARRSCPTPTPSPCAKDGPTTFITARWRPGRSTPSTSKLVYTLVYDTSLVPGDDAAKKADVRAPPHGVHPRT